MKKTFTKISALSVTLLVLATSCKKGDTGPAGATGPAGPSLTGNTQGVVSLYDVGGAKQLSATLQAGDSLILTNSTTSQVWKTTTSSTGAFSFANLSSGTYNVAVSKPGYGKVLAQGVQILGGGTTDRNFALSVIPTTNVVSAVALDTTMANGGAASTPENYVKVRGYVPVSSSATTVMIFVSIPGMSSTSSAVGNWSVNYTVNVLPGVSKFSVNIPTSSLYDLGFPSGGTATAFFAAYIVGNNTSASSYVDWTTGQTVYTALSTTPVNVQAQVQ